MDGKLMNLKYLLCLLLFPWSAFGVNTNQIDNLWVPVSARFSYGTPAVGKVFTSDASGFGTWSILSTTGGINDARYVMKAGFSSGPQAIDGNFTMGLTNYSPVLSVFGSNAFFDSSLVPMFIQAPTNGKSLWIRGNQTGVDEAFITIGSDPTSRGSLAGVGSSNLYVGVYNGSAAIVRPLGTGFIDIMDYPGNIYFRGSGSTATMAVNTAGIIGAAGNNLTIKMDLMSNINNFVSIKTNVLTGIRYPLADGASNAVLTTYGNGTTAFLALPASSNQVVTNGSNIYSATSTNSFVGYNQFGTNALFTTAFVTNFNVINGPMAGRAIGSLLIYGTNPSSFPQSQLSIGADSRQGLYSGSSNLTMGVYNDNSAYIGSGVYTLTIIGASSNTSLQFGGAGTMTYHAVTHTFDGTTMNLNSGTINVTGNTTVKGTFATTNTTVIGAGGTTITWIRSASGTLGYAGGAAGGTEDKTITLTGTTTNDGVYVGNPIDLPTDSVFQVFPSAVNTITVRRTSTVISGVYTGVFKVFVTH